MTRTLIDDDPDLRRLIDLRLSAIELTARARPGDVEEGSAA